LTARDGVLGVYSRSAGAYTEFAADGRPSGTWNIPLASREVEILAVGLTPSNTVVFGGFNSATGEVVSYQLQKSSGSFVPIPIPQRTQSARLLTFLGTNDGELVYYGRPTTIIRMSVDE
jgi:hypothetical protein